MFNQVSQGGGEVVALQETSLKMAPAFLHNFEFFLLFGMTKKNL
jgi:hypothetical protein